MHSSAWDGSRTRPRFGAWLLAIAANRARMALRRRRRLAVHELPLDSPVPSSPAGADLQPEDVWASREIHEEIMAALRELPAATRELVIGYYIGGYSYQELAELFGIPVSTVRGRLYHGRRRLRRSLRPLAQAALQPALIYGEEARMDTVTAPLDAHVAFVGHLAFSTNCVVMLQEEGGPRRLALEGVEAGTGEAIERLLRREQPLRPTTHDLLARLLTALEARVEQVVIRRLVGEALYADISLDSGEQHCDVEAQPGDAVALALLTGSPIRIAAAVMNAAGFDPTDREDQLLREERELDRLRRRVAERAAPPATSPIE
jgi:uncharacterized protein